MTRIARRRAASKARLNLQLPEELLESLRRRAEQLQTTPPELARRLLRQGLEEIEREELDRRLVEGYRALAEENRRLLEEFSAVDSEGWEPDGDSETIP
jgi:metal-responsive CopG/Arc/MetJ family transcriptional regulator